MKEIINRYRHIPGNHQLVFDILCSVLTQTGGKNELLPLDLTNWNLLLQMAVGEGVAARFFEQIQHQLDLTELLLIAPQTMKKFSSHAAQTAIQNGVMFKHLEIAVRELNECGISPVLLKGADLSQTLYPSQRSRPMGDLDLLVRESEFDPALRLLHQLGYQEYIPEVLANFNQAISHHSHLRKTGPVGIILELHWILIASPAHRHSVSMEWFWQNIQPLRPWNNSLAPYSAFTLNPTSNLLYLAAHLILQHGGSQATLRSILDIHRLIQYQGNQLDWQNLVKQAQVFNWSSALLGALNMSESCFQTRLPVDVIEALQSKSGQLDDLVISKFKKSDSRIVEEWKRILALKAKDRPRLLIALLMPSPAYIRWRYKPSPSWLWPFYYFYRWADIGMEVVKTIGKYSRKKTGSGTH